jgi:hypothetical protein
MRNRPSIDNILNLENSDAGGTYLLRVSHGSVKLSVTKMGHMMNRSM